MEKDVIKREYDIHGANFVAFDIESSKTLQYLQDEFDIDLMGLQEYSFPEDATIVDIGANVGVISFYFAKKYPRAKIYAYEPHPENYKNLLRGIEENELANVFPYNLAVLEESGYEVEIHLDEENSGASSMYYPSKKSSAVETISIKDIVVSNGIKKIDYLKLDCEGAEFDILEKSTDLYTGEIIVDNMFVEIHSFMQREGGRSIIDLMTKLRNLRGVNNFRYFIV